MTTLWYHEVLLLLSLSFKLAVCWLWGLSQVTLSTAPPTNSFFCHWGCRSWFCFAHIYLYGHLWSRVHTSHRICLSWLPSSRQAEQVTHVHLTDGGEQTPTGIRVTQHTKDKAQSFVHPALGLGRLQESHIYTNPSNPVSCNTICQSSNLLRNKNYLFPFLFPVCSFH